MHPEPELTLADLDALDKLEREATPITAKDLDDLYAEKIKAKSTGGERTLAELAEVVIRLIPVSTHEPLTTWQRNNDQRILAAASALRLAIARTLAALDSARAEAGRLRERVVELEGLLVILGDWKNHPDSVVDAAKKQLDAEALAIAQRTKPSGQEQP